VSALVDSANAGRLEVTRRSSSWADSLGNEHASATVVSPFTVADPRTFLQRWHAAFNLATRECYQIVLDSLVDGTDHKSGEPRSASVRRMRAYLKREPLRLEHLTSAGDSYTSDIIVTVAYGETPREVTS
jgi:hypothetical protein